MIALACEVVHIFLARGELVFCILLERFRGGLCVLFLEFLMSFCLIICGLRGVYAFDPGLYCYLQELCYFKVILTIEYKVLAGPINSS